MTPEQIKCVRHCGKAIECWLTETQLLIQKNGRHSDTPAGCQDLDYREFTLINNLNELFEQFPDVFPNCESIPQSQGAKS